MPKARSQKRVENAEQSVGFQLLEFYIATCLRDKRYKLELEAKRNLRLCCKKFKAIFDGAITQASWNIDYFHLYSDSQLIAYKVNNERCKSAEPLPVTLDQICQKFSSIATLDARSRSTGLEQDQEILKDNFPDSIGQLALKRLEISRPFQRKALSLPSFLSHLGDTLEELDIYSAVDDITPLQHCMKLKSLQIKLSTSEVPSFIGDLTELTSLKLSNHFQQKSSLPACLSNLKKLKKLTLYVWHIATPLPDIFGEMKSLTYLDLSLVQGISKLPRSFGKMAALKELRLSTCEELEELPATFGKLKRLKMLYITECPALHEFPDSFGDLESLKSLEIHESGCSYLPDSIGKLKKTLKKIRLVNCQIHTLPRSIFRLVNIKTLIFDDCYRLPMSCGTFVAPVWQGVIFWQGGL